MLNNQIYEYNPICVKNNVSGGYIFCNLPKHSLLYIYFKVLLINCKSYFKLMPLLKTNL